MMKVELQKVANTLTTWSVIFKVNDKVMINEQYPNYDTALVRARYFKYKYYLCKLVIIR